ncbi:MAG: vitamin K epoxide reductase family protein [Anaerolineae bacterium]|nr:vitamin K epoxide reductase family protein [Anaerolineae bacterium]
MLAQSAYVYYHIPEDNWVVPMMMVGDQVLIGGIDIPAQLPGLVETGLAQGGIDLPTFPGIREAYEAYRAQNPEATPEAEAARSAPAAAPTLAERLTADPLANGLAIGVLAALMVSLLAVLLRHPIPESWAWGARLIVLAVGILLALTLVMNGAPDSLAAPLAWASLIGLLVAGALFVRGTNSALIPLVALVGLLDAGYLAYVELTQSEAVCGAVGNCNAVQQSAYAQLFGIPIGVLGLVGYAAVALLWLLAWRLKQPIYRLALFAVALIGVLFSSYLTFLEPFVIGATCAWCLLSAVLMLGLLWLTAPAGWDAWGQMRPHPPAPGMRPDRSPDPV